MKPSIGRIVHYEHEGQTLPAIVTNVLSDTIVNLCIFKDSLGSYFHEGVEMGEGEGQWRWPQPVLSPMVNTGSNVPPVSAAAPPSTVVVPHGTATGQVGGTPLVTSSLPSVSKP